MGAEEEKVSHSVEPDLVKLENPEEAAPRLEEVARVSEGEEENKSLIYESLIKSINFRNIRLKYDEENLEKHFEERPEDSRRLDLPPIHLRMNFKAYLRISQY